MKQQITLQLVGSVVFVAFGASLYNALRIREQQQFKDAFLSLLMQKINPTTAGLSAEAGFDIHYAAQVLRKVNGRVVVLKESVAKKLADSIHNNFRPWYLRGDNEEGVYAILRTLKDKVQLSQVSKAYQDTYKINLIDQLQQRFDADEVKKVLAIVAPKPPYTTV